MPTDPTQRLTGPERPIENNAEDVLARGDFVRRLSDTLISPRSGQASGVVIGITGPWGSGKSSVLNLLEQALHSRCPDALVVRFDPWLVSSRDDVIAAYFTALVDAMKKLGNSRVYGVARDQQLTEAIEAIAAYGGTLAPILNIAKPGLSIVGNFLVKSAEKALKSRRALDRQKKVVADALRALELPIVVLIDELDRVEDTEIKIMAQVVRSIADFAEISYVLAYDDKRVMQALGDKDVERGRSYLEKIVQLQIPLPITLDDQLSRLLEAELTTSASTTGLPADFPAKKRYQEMIDILVPELIQTPRDVKRLAETFHALGGMVRGEVDATDLLGYCALMTKAPQVVADITKDPLAFVEDAISLREAARRQEREKKYTQFEELVPSLKAGDEPLKKLLVFLFPTLSRDGGRPVNVIDPICLRRPLLTTLHLGLLEGDYSRSEVEKLVHSQESEIIASLKDAYRSDRLGALIDRLGVLYISFADIDHVLFWKAVAEFLRKPDCNWMTQYTLMGEVTRSFADVLQQLAHRDQQYGAIVAQVFRNLHNANEDSLVPILLRHQIFLHDLFGNRSSGDASKAFLNKEQTSALALELSKTVRAQHMSGKFVPCRWDLQPLFTAIDTGVWDDQCRAALDETISSEEALDGLTLMLFGSGFATGGDTIEKMCGYQNYRTRVKLRLSMLSMYGVRPVHDSVRLALQKADEDMWAPRPKGAQI